MFSERTIYTALVVTALLTVTTVGFQSRAEDSAGQHGSIWNLGTLEAEQTYPTTVAAMNRSCRGSHTFSIAIEGQATAFLKLVGPSELSGVREGETRTTDALVDLRGVAAGRYDSGQVVVRCLSCPKRCNQDYERLTVQLVVSAPQSVAAATAGPVMAQTAGQVGSTRTRTPCPDPAKECDELRQAAEAAEQRAKTERREADFLREQQAQRDADASALDSESVKDVAYADTLRRQSAEYEDLARASEASARKNHERAAAQPEGSRYRTEWEQAARFDELEAARRRAEAERLAEEANRVQGGMHDKRERADALRSAAATAEAEAVAAEAEARAKRAAYENCLKQVAEECKRAEAAAAAAASAAQASTGGAGSVTSTKSTPPPPADPYAPGGMLSEYPKPPLQSSNQIVCKWVEHEIGDVDDEIESVYVSDTTGDAKRVAGANPITVTEGVVELEVVPRTARSGPRIRIHCTAAGVAVVHVVYREFETRRRDRAHQILNSTRRVERFLVGCNDEE